MLKKLLLSLTLLLILFNSTKAQNLKEDTPFFNQQSQLYQKWLDHNGYGNWMKVREIDIQDKFIMLYLEFKFSDIENIVNAWKIMKATYEEKHITTFEEGLFYKMTSIFELDNKQAKIAIFNTYDPLENPAFLRGIKFDSGKVVVVTDNPKSEIREIKLDPGQMIGNAQKMSQADFKKKYTKRYVFNKIIDYSRSYFERKTCINRSPSLEILENQENLRFEITDLCKEVLIDESEPLLCQILKGIGRDCNWKKREKLDITIAYEPTDVGFQLSIEIDGKYGSGLYNNVKRGGYYSMEIDFDEYLERYSDKFKELVRKEILRR